MPGYLGNENDIKHSLLSGVLLGMILFIPEIIYCYMKDGFDVVLLLFIQNPISEKVSERDL